MIHSTTIQNIARELPAPAQLHPHILAYIGDAVYELYVRTMMVHRMSGKVGKLHQHTAHMVSAPQQASLLGEIEPALTAEEADIVRRGKNAKTNQTPKAASQQQYRLATGFEALIGYLYLAGCQERIEALLETAMLEQ